MLLVRPGTYLGYDRGEIYRRGGEHWSFYALTTQKKSKMTPKVSQNQMSELKET